MKKKMSDPEDKPAKTPSVTRTSSACFVPGCKSGYKSDKDKKKLEGKKANSLFRPPAGPYFELWKKSIPRKDMELTRRHAICELHFPEECIERNFVIHGLPGGATLEFPRSVPSLKKGSIPSIFPNDPRPSAKAGKKSKCSKRKGLENKNSRKSRLKNVSTRKSPSPLSKDHTIKNVFLNESKLLEDIGNRYPIVKLVKLDLGNVTSILHKSLSPVTVGNTVSSPAISQQNIVENSENRNCVAEIFKLAQPSSEYSTLNFNDASIEQRISLIGTSMNVLPNQPHLLEIIESVPSSNMQRTDLNYTAKNVCDITCEGDLSPISKSSAVSTVSSNEQPSESYKKNLYKNSDAVNSAATQIFEKLSNDASMDNSNHIESGLQNMPLEAAEKTIFDKLKENINSVEMLNNWGCIQCFPDIIAFVKWDENYSAERKIIFDSKLNLKVFLGEKEVFLMEESLSSIEHISAILYKIDCLQICRGAADKEVPDCLVVTSTVPQTFSECIRFCDNCLAYKKKRAQALWHKALHYIISNKIRSKKVKWYQKKNNRLRKRIENLKRKLKIEQTCATAALEYLA